MPILVGSYNRFPNMAQYDVFIAELGPAAWWKLNDPLGAMVAYDSSGNGYTGTVNGEVVFGQPGPIVGAPQDTAALFDGTSGYLTTAYKPDGVVSLIVWFRTTNTGLAVIADSGAVTVSGGLYLLLNGNGANQVQCAVYSSTSQVNILDPSICDGAWHLAAMTYDGATLRSYYDGSPGPMAAYSVAIASPVGTVLGSSAYPNDYFSGSIAEVAIFPYALSAAQVAKAYSLAS